MNALTYSQKEEILSSAIHGLGILLGLIGSTALVVLALVYGTQVHVLSYVVYGLSYVLLFTASTLYHAIPNVRAKHLLKICDHACIYLLIAGTYTPFLMLHLEGNLRFGFMVLIWGMAFFGVIFKFYFTGRFKYLSTIIYVIMGWLVVFASKPLSLTLNPKAMDYLILGGVIYTVGTIFYLLKKIPYTHALWHLFVLLGSLAHFRAVIYTLTL